MKESNLSKVIKTYMISIIEHMESSGCFVESSSCMRTAVDAGDVDVCIFPESLYWKHGKCKILSSMILCSTWGRRQAVDKFFCRSYSGILMSYCSSCNTFESLWHCTVCPGYGVQTRCNLKYSIVDHSRSMIDFKNCERDHWAALQQQRQFYFKSAPGQWSRTELYFVLRRLRTTYMKVHCSFSLDTMKCYLSDALMFLWEMVRT